MPGKGRRNASPRGGADMTRQGKAPLVQGCTRLTGAVPNYSKGRASDHGHFRSLGGAAEPCCIHGYTSSLRKQRLPGFVARFAGSSMVSALD